MSRNRIYSMLGIAARAGAVSSGAFAAESSIRAGKAYMAVIAADASDNTKKQYRDMCKGHGTAFYEYGSMDDLGHAIGKGHRAALTVNDASLARAVEELLRSEQTGEE